MMSAPESGSAAETACNADVKMRPSMRRSSAIANGNQEESARAPPRDAILRWLVEIAWIGS